MSFPYRGDDEEWSQQYHFTGSAPSTDTDWRSLCDDLGALLQATLGYQTKIVRFYCYEDTDDDSVYTYELADWSGTLTGALTKTTGDDWTPGDTAAWVRWKTARTNTHGKPIYLRKYFHGVFVTPAGDEGDALATNWKTALETFGAAVNSTSGDWPGIAGPDGVAPGLVKASSYVTTRTLKRRGVRPH